MNGQCNLMIKNVFRTKKGTSCISFLVEKQKNEYSKGFNDLEVWYENDVPFKNITSDIILKPLVADYVFVERYNGTADKKITKVYVVDKNGTIQSDIDLLA